MAKTLSDFTDNEKSVITDYATQIGATVDVVISSFNLLDESDQPIWSWVSEQAEKSS